MLPFSYSAPIGIVIILSGSRFAVGVIPLKCKFENLHSFFKKFFYIIFLTISAFYNAKDKNLEEVNNKQKREYRNERRKNLQSEYRSQNNWLDSLVPTQTQQSIFINIDNHQEVNNHFDHYHSEVNITENNEVKTAEINDSFLQKIVRLWEQLKSKQKFLGFFFSIFFFLIPPLKRWYKLFKIEPIKGIAKSIKYFSPSKHLRWLRRKVWKFYSSLL